MACNFSFQWSVLSALINILSMSIMSMCWSHRNPILPVKMTELMNFRWGVDVEISNWKATCVTPSSLYPGKFSQWDILLCICFCFICINLLLHHLRPFILMDWLRLLTAKSLVTSNIMLLRLHKVTKDPDQVLWTLGRRSVGVSWKMSLDGSFHRFP